MIWDGNCGFCRRWIVRWRRLTGRAVDDEPYQRAADRFPGIHPEQFAAAVHLIEPDGTVTRAAEAALKSLALAGRAKWLWRLYRSVRCFRWGAEGVYRWVALHRNLLDRIERKVLRVP